jgi:hypothetical protein
MVIIDYIDPGKVTRGADIYDGKHTPFQVKGLCEGLIKKQAFGAN